MEPAAPEQFDRRVEHQVPSSDRTVIRRGGHRARFRRPRPLWLPRTTAEVVSSSIASHDVVSSPCGVGAWEATSRTEQSGSAPVRLEANVIEFVPEDWASGLMQRRAPRPVVVGSAAAWYARGSVARTSARSVSRVSASVCSSSCALSKCATTERCPCTPATPMKAARQPTTMRPSCTRPRSGRMTGFARLTNSGPNQAGSNGEVREEHARIRQPREYVVSGRRSVPGDDQM